MKDDFFSIGFQSGVVTSAIVGFMIYALHDLGVPIDELIDEYQTLFSALLASFAALVGAQMVLSQVREVRRIDQQRVANAHRAERAMLPAACSSMIKFSCANMKALMAMLPPPNATDPDHIDFQSLRKNPPERPELEISTLNDLKNTIENAPEEVAEKLSDLLAVYQIHVARCTSIWNKIDCKGSSNEIVLRHNIESNLLDAMELHALTASMFDYARRIHSTIHPLDEERLWNAAHSCSIAIENTKYLSEMFSVSNSISARLGRVKTKME